MIQRAKRLGAAVVVVLVVATGLALARPSTSSAAPKVDPWLTAELENSSSGDRLVFVHAANIDLAAAAVKESGLSLVETWDGIGVAVGSGSKAEILRAAELPSVTYLEGNRPIELDMMTSHLASRGQDALDGFSGTDGHPGKNPHKKKDGASAGVDGSGVTIAIVDSGVDATHPMFQQNGQTKVLRNLRIACSQALDQCNGPQGNANDDVWIPMDDTDSPLGGHGTHVSGTAGGVQVTTADGRQLHGAAPGSKLVVLATGFLLNLYGAISGLNWVLEHHAEPCGPGVSTTVCPPIKVVNNSWSAGAGDHNPNDSAARLADALVGAGVTVVWAASNAGGDGQENTVSAYAQSPTPGVIGVANYDDAGTGTRDGNLADSSSRGREGAPATYPDIAAPGSHITSACRPTTPICTSLDGVDDPNYGTISGTSMAAPHIAGVVAQLVQAGRQSLGRDLTPAEIEDILEDNAFKFTFGGDYESDPRNTDNTTSFDKGHGLVDVKKSVAEIRALGLGAEPGPLPALKSCSKGGTTMLDPADDTFIVKFIPTNTDVPPYEPQLDLTEGSLAWDGTGQALTATFRVVDLDDQNGLSTPVASYNVNFYRGAERFYLEATRDPDGEKYRFGRWVMASNQGARFVITNITGSFDPATDRIAARITNADLLSAGLTPLNDGEILKDISFASRRAVSTDTTTAGATTDSTDDVCQFVVGQGLTPVPVPSISLASPIYEWDGPITTDTTLFGELGCEGLSSATCHDTKINVTVPEGGTWMKVSITADLEDVNDFDFDVFDPQGNDIGGSANGGTIDETDTVPASVSGIYTVRVIAFASVNANYHGVAELGVSAPPPAPEPPFDGQISLGETYEWGGDPPFDANLIFTCASLVSPICDNEFVKINVPSGGAKVHITITADFEGDDFDLWFYDADNTQYGSTQAGDEVFELDVTKSCVCRIGVTAAFAPLGTYKGTISLLPKT